MLVLASSGQTHWNLDAHRQSTDNLAQRRSFSLVQAQGQ